MDNISIYQRLFELIHEYVYGNVELTNDMNLVCTLLSTAGSIFLVALPFILVWNVIKLINGD